MADIFGVNFTHHTLILSLFVTLIMHVSYQYTCQGVFILLFLFGGPGGGGVRGEGGCKPRDLCAYSVGFLYPFKTQFVCVCVFVCVGGGGWVGREIICVSVCACESVGGWIVWC